ncbi:type II toxin-antitoxin system VapB family antitoxin [Pseudomonas sp. NFXW11]|uniref:type II toxin-antitoxin system VapB family antitoxin n=1 Tax=Pseudomonas sp. NFXW11 TaxID=2819531 RepID=UPI003CF1219E
MQRAKVIRTQRRQWIALPDSAALPGRVNEVEVLIVGQTRVLVPVGHSWDSWFDEDPASEDFMSERDQPASGSARADFDER